MKSEKEIFIDDILEDDTLNDTISGEIDPMVILNLDLSLGGLSNLNPTKKSKKALIDSTLL